MTTSRTRTLLLPTLVLGAVLVVGSTGGAVAGAMITGKQVKDSSLTGKDVRNGSLTAADLAAAALPAGPAGAAGPRGPAGQPGGAGPAGTSGYEVVTVVGSPFTGSRSVTASCPAGKRVLGTAADFTNSFTATSVRLADDNASADAFGSTPGTDRLRLSVVCARVD